VSLCAASTIFLLSAMRVDVSFNDILWLWLANGKVKRLYLLRNSYIFTTSPKSNSI
jgi:hypothetical protein